MKTVALAAPSPSEVQFGGDDGPDTSAGWPGPGPGAGRCGRRSGRRARARRCRSPGQYPAFGGGGSGLTVFGGMWCCDFSEKTITCGNAGSLELVRDEAGMPGLRTTHSSARTNSLTRAKPSGWASARHSRAFDSSDRDPSQRNSCTGPTQPRSPPRQAAPAPPGYRCAHRPRSHRSTRSVRQPGVRGALR